jgi:hypothetical protein
MTKGERLIWDLFMKLREVVPATPENTKWAGEWSALFHEMEHPAPAVEPEHQAQPSADDDDDVPHVRAAPKRKR